MRAGWPSVRQWLWFAGLWAAGVAAVGLVGLLIRLVLR
jgi:preprotein translocase subunit Sss1